MPVQQAEQPAITVTESRSGQCPSCGQETAFSYLGEQRWPARLVEQAGFPPVTHLWTCEQCHTTLSEPSLRR